MQTRGRTWKILAWATMTAVGFAACAKQETQKDDDDETFDPTTTGTGASGGSGGSGAGGMTGGGGNIGTCDATPWTDDATCTTCLETSCCFALNACEPGSDCLAFQACVEACGGDFGCADMCTDDHETGVVAVEALAACNRDSCESCAMLPQTDYGCAGILAAHQDKPLADCAAMSCCAEVVDCELDANCDLGQTLFGDSAPSALLDCLSNNCAQ